MRGQDQEAAKENKRYKTENNTPVFSRREREKARERDTRDVSESLERKREGGGFVSEIG